MLPRIALTRAVDEGHVPLPVDLDEVRIPRASISGRDSRQIQLLRLENMHAMQRRFAFVLNYVTCVVDVHTLVGKVAPCAHADKEVGAVVDYMPGVIPEHLAVSFEEDLPPLFEGRRRGVVGEVQWIASPVRRREEVEARISKREVELVVLDVRGAVRPGDDVRVSDASPAP